MEPVRSSDNNLSFLVPFPKQTQNLSEHQAKCDAANAAAVEANTFKQSLNKKQETTDLRYEIALSKVH